MSSNLILGINAPAPESTNGYALNHCALVVHDIDAMRSFYCDILGMRHIMTKNVSPIYSFTYLGHAVPEKGFQTSEQMLKELRQRNGLLELLHPNGVGQQDDDCRVGRFSHLGFVVPDLKATQDRLDRLSVSVLKRVGVDSVEAGSIVAKWWGLDDVQIKAMAGSSTGLSETLLVLDPEGNVVELQERE